MLFETATTTAPPPRKKIKRQVNAAVYELLRPGAWIEPYLPDNYLKAFKLFRPGRILVRYVTAGDFRRLKKDGVLKLARVAGFELSRKAVIALRANNIIKQTYLTFMDEELQRRRLSACVCARVAPLSCKPKKHEKRNQ